MFSNMLEIQNCGVIQCLYSPSPTDLTFTLLDDRHYDIIILYIPVSLAVFHMSLMAAEILFIQLFIQLS